MRCNRLVRGRWIVVATMALSANAAAGVSDLIFSDDFEAAIPRLSVADVSVEEGNRRGTSGEDAIDPANFFGSPHHVRLVR